MVRPVFLEKHKKIRIAFHLRDHVGWTAGIVYLGTLLQALKETNPDDWSIGLLGRNGDLSKNLSLLELADDVIASQPIERWTSAWVIHSLGSRIFHRNVVDDQLLKKHGIDVVAFGEAPEGSKIPALGWIADFQHLHFPEFFSDRELQDRNLAFSRLAERSARVILISESARRDFEGFVPQWADKARVLHPLTVIPDAVYNSDPDSVCTLYHLPRKFVFLPNQFWKHKNHIAVFQAVKILKEKGLSVSLVCSGYSGDYRHSTLFSELLLEISRLDIRDQVALLGVLPRDHVFQLMRRSICVVNPSQFEGYGMTVDEAQSLGKPMLLSDIPAHREQNPAGAVFFDALNSEELAEKMENIWLEGTPGPNVGLEAAYRRELPERRRKYAESFMAVVREVVI